MNQAENNQMKKYNISYGDNKLEFNEAEKSGTIKDKVNGEKKELPIFMTKKVSDDVKSSDAIKKKVEDALQDETFAGWSAEKGIKFLEDRSGKPLEKSLDRHLVEMKILGRKGDDKTGLNPGQWRAFGVLDNKSAGIDQEGKKKEGAIYLLETTSEKEKESFKLMEKIKKEYNGDCKTTNSSKLANAEPLQEKNKKKERDN